MLVLTRRLNEIVMIDSDIEIKILAVKGRQVRLGIKAPRNVSVDRQEMRERKEAAALSALPIVLSGSSRLQ